MPNMTKPEKKLVAQFAMPMKMASLLIDEREGGRFIMWLDVLKLSSILQILNVLDKERSNFLYVMYWNHRSQSELPQTIIVELVIGR